MISLNKIKKAGIACLCILSLASLSGCDKLQPSTKPLKESEKTSSQKDAVTVLAKTTVQKLAEQKHVQFSLSDDFMSKYLDMSSFEELKARTLAGMKATQNEAGMTSNEIRLWQAIIKTKIANQYTTADLAKRTAELNSALDQLAKENNQSLEEFLKEYGMNKESAEDFVNKQAAKYDVNSDKEAQEDTESNK